MKTEKFLIKGGKPLTGKISISGAKNSALPLMAATLLCPGKHKIKNVPLLKDVITMAQLLKSLGTEVQLQDGVGKRDTSNMNSLRAD